MPQKQLEFFFDFGSPTAYLAASQLPRMAQETGAVLRWRPMLLGGVFKATGNASPVSIPAKGRWMFQDLSRWAARWQTPLVLNKHFPINTLSLMRMATGLQLRDAGRFDAFVHAVYAAIWAQGLNMGDAEVVAASLTAAGFDAAALMALAADAEVKAALVATTDEAVARGAFGAPTMFVGEQMFFGQDRLDFVREALLA